MTTRPRSQVSTRPAIRQVALLALPEMAASTLVGIYDVMNGASLMGLIGPGAEPPFRIDIVGETTGPMPLASGLPVDVQRAIGTIDDSDIVIVPSVLLQRLRWERGRYPLLVDWLERMHRGGALLCSACSGIFLLAETGLWDGKATLSSPPTRGVIRQHRAGRPPARCPPRRRGGDPT